MAGNRALYSKTELLEFDRRVNNGFLRKVELNNMVLYGYTDKCTFEKAWDEYTLIARGIVINKDSGRVMARPFPKFFNLNEIEDTKLENLPMKEGYHVFDKVDGSLGIIFWDGSQWRLNTRGSFESEQAVKGREILNKYRMQYLDRSFTYLVEIIYPENKIIVDYGTEEKLVLLSAYHTWSGKELNPEILGYVATQLGMESAMVHAYTIDEIIDMQKTLPKDQEGFVVRFSNGMRVKIKGDEYMRLARAIANMTPLEIWRNMRQGVVDRQFLSSLPEEFRTDFTPIVSDLEAHYHMIVKEMLDDYGKLPTRKLDDNEDRKVVASFLKHSRIVKHPLAMFAFLDKKWTITDKYIMNKIKPHGNELREA